MVILLTFVLSETQPCELQRTQAVCMQLFVRARRAEFFQKFCNYFARVLREGLRDFGASLGRFFISTHFKLAKEMQRRSAVCATYIGRVHANFVRAVRRNSGNFAILSRDFGAKFA